MLRSSLAGAGRGPPKLIHRVIAIPLIRPMLAPWYGKLNSILQNIFCEDNLKPYFSLQPKAENYVIENIDTSFFF